MIRNTLVAAMFGVIALSAADAQSVADGEAVFTQTCARCHADPAELAEIATDSQGFAATMAQHKPKVRVDLDALRAYLMDLSED